MCWSSFLSRNIIPLINEQFSALPRHLLQPSVMTSSLFFFFLWWSYERVQHRVNNSRKITKVSFRKKYPLVLEKRSHPNLICIICICWFPLPFRWTQQSNGRIYSRKAETVSTKKIKKMKENRKIMNVARWYDFANLTFNLRALDCADSVFLSQRMERQWEVPTTRTPWPKRQVYHVHKAHGNAKPLDGPQIVGKHFGMPF